MNAPLDPRSQVSFDVADLRRLWDARRAAMRIILQRVDPRGLTRPARDPDERDWIDLRDEGAFIEDPAAGRSAREYCQRRYNRPEP